MDKNEYIQAYKLIESLEDNINDKLKGNSFDSLTINEVTEAGVGISTTYTHCSGCGTDYDNDFFTWEEMAMDADIYKAHRAEKNRIAAEQKKAMEQAAKEEKAKADALKKEEADRKQYEKLKAKFENNA